MVNLPIQAESAGFCWPCSRFVRSCTACRRSDSSLSLWCIRRPASTNQGCPPPRARHDGTAQDARGAPNPPPGFLPPTTWNRTTTQIAPTRAAPAAPARARGVGADVGGARARPRRVRRAGHPDRRDGVPGLPGAEPGGLRGVLRLRRRRRRGRARVPGAAGPAVGGRRGAVAAAAHGLHRRVRRRGRAVRLRRAGGPAGGGGLM